MITEEFLLNNGFSIRPDDENISEFEKRQWRPRYHYKNDKTRYHCFSEDAWTVHREKPDKYGTSGLMYIAMNKNDELKEYLEKFYDKCRTITVETYDNKNDCDNDNKPTKIFYQKYDMYGKYVYIAMFAQSYTKK
jgi:hypothetical protein